LLTHGHTSANIFDLFHVSACNTLKFVSLKIELNWFIYIFLCSWKYRKIKIFIELKFIIGCSNIFVHTCWCIYFIVMYACCLTLWWEWPNFSNRVSKSFIFFDLSLSFSYNQIPYFSAQVSFGSFRKYLLCNPNHFFQFLANEPISKNFTKLFRFLLEFVPTCLWA